MAARSRWSTPGTAHRPTALRSGSPRRGCGSTNYQLISRGLAYPTYYSKLYPDLRRALTTGVKKVRTEAAGLWPSDLTTTGVEVTGLDTLTDHAVIMPQLFRRLMDYLALGAGDLSPAGFPAFLAARDDRLLILSTGHLTGFGYVVEVDQQHVRLNRTPEDLVFIEA